MRDVDERELQLLVDLLELASQQPLELRVDHRQRLIEQHRGDVRSHQAAAQRDLLLLVGGQRERALAQDCGQLQDLGDFADPPAVTSAAAQRRLRNGNARLSKTVIVS